MHDGHGRSSTLSIFESSIAVSEYLMFESFARGDIMRRIGSRHLPVMDGDRIVGMLSIRDLYAAIHEELEEGLRQRDDFIMGSGYSVVPPVWFTFLKHLFAAVHAGSPNCLR